MRKKLSAESIAKEIIKKISTVDPPIIFDWNEQEDKVMKEIIIPKIQSLLKEQKEIDFHVIGSLIIVAREIQLNFNVETHEKTLKWAAKHIASILKTEP